MDGGGSVRLVKAVLLSSLALMISMRRIGVQKSWKTALSTEQLFLTSLLEVGHAGNLRLRYGSVYSDPPLQSALLFSSLHGGSCR